jgi:hypothetical protein
MRGIGGVASTSNKDPAEHGHRRVLGLARALDRLLRAAGWVWCQGFWRERGRVTVRNVSGRTDPMEQAVARERARRAFERAPDLDDLIRKFEVDVAAVHLRELVDRITDDPMRREATKRAALRSAAELAGPDASPILRQIAMSVVMFTLESHLASARLLAAAGTWAAPSAALVRWRASAETRLNARIKTLAHVRHMETSSLQGSLARLRIAAAG